ncbi:MAG: hypothetical protein IJZ34_03040 [Lachnospiraceae bacterium]|nr:hypothetical protein [Lachnospiraceae bacterium]
MLNVKKHIAQVLAVVILLVSIPFEVNATTATSSDIPEELQKYGFVVGNDLIDTTLAAGTTIPYHEDANWTQSKDEWSYGRPLKAWSWWRVDTVTPSATVSSGDVISSVCNGSDGIILLPTLPSSNYKFEATFTVNDNPDAINGSFGLITNIAPDYAKSTGGTMFVVCAAGHARVTGGKTSIYTWNKPKKVSGEAAATYHQPDWDYTAPGAGDKITLTVYVYNGVNYYYIDGHYVAYTKSLFTTEGESLCGFFNSGKSDMVLDISDISVKELKEVVEEEVPSELEKIGFAIGNELIDTSLAAGTTIPYHEDADWSQSADEWSYGRPLKAWSWWRVDTVTPSATVSSGDVISSVCNGSDGIILLPKLPSSNYKFEATFTVNDNPDAINGSFGLITNIAPDYKKSIGGTMFVVCAAGHARVTGGKTSIYTWNKPKKISGETAATYYTPDWDYTAPGAGDEITLTIYVYNGVNYYYVDGNYVGYANSKFTTEGESLCGFFNSGKSDMVLDISNISVKELVAKDSSDGDDSDTGGRFPEGPAFDESSLPIGDVLYQTDFEDVAVGALPEGWQKGYTGNGASFGYGVSDTSLRSMIGEVVTLDGYGNVLRFSSANADAFITTPATGTLDYIFEANVIVNFDTEGEFGLANNFYTGINDAQGCMYNSSHIKLVDTDSTFKYRPTNKTLQGTWDLSYYPAKGDIAKLKIVSYKGYNYICCNDVLCAVAPRREADGATSDNPGFFTYGGDIYITDVKVTEIHNDDAEIVIDGASVSVTDDGKVGIDVAVSFDKTQYVYSKFVNGDYTYSDDAALKFGVVMAIGNSQVPEDITVNTADVVNTIFTTCSQDDSKIAFTHTISDIPEENYDRFYTVRPYTIVEGIYYYGEVQAYSAALLANGVYALTDDDELKDKLADALGGSKVFVGKDAASLTFTLFSDFHYKEKMYPNSIADLNLILKRADDSNSAFIMSAGDFCNDRNGSPELFNTYLNYITEEGELLPAYNIYGNHELETAGNTMEGVTATLTNDTNVVWGTADGSYDYNIAYYYFESNGFRIVCIDTQYSYNPITEKWEHNKSASYGAPEGNILPRSLTPTQLTWLEGVLTDAADKDIPCIVVGHDGFTGLGFATTSSDSDAVRAIFKKVNDLNPGTVLMCINGHVHTNNQGYNEGVFYMDTNCTRNGVFVTANTDIYTSSEHTFMYEEYDAEGNLISITEQPLSMLSAGDNTWFYADPLSAVVTINEYGVITIDGTESTWAYGIVPSSASEVTGKVPRISTGTYFTCDLIGHSIVYKADETHHWTECSNTLCKKATQPVAHTYDQKVVSDEYKATDVSCEAKATYYYSCVCGAKGTETFEVGELAKHSYGEWKVVKEATANEKGLKERECSVCGDTETEEIPVISTDTPGTEDVPSTPGTEDVPSTPGTEDVPSTPGTEDAPSTPGTEDSPSAPGVEDTPDTPEDEDTSEIPETEEVPVADANAPETGDDFSPVLWLGIIFVCGAVLSVGVVYYRRKREQ